MLASFSRFGLESPLLCVLMDMARAIIRAPLTVPHHKWTMQAWDSAYASRLAEMHMYFHRRATQILFLCPQVMKRKRVTACRARSVGRRRSWKQIHSQQATLHRNVGVLYHGLVQRHDDVEAAPQRVGRSVFKHFVDALCFMAR